MVVSNNNSGSLYDACPQNLRIEVVAIFFENLGNARIVVFLAMCQIDGQYIEVELEEDFEFGRRILLIEMVELREQPQFTDTPW